MRKLPDPYPWLDEDDPQGNMTNDKILYKYIDLSKSHLTSKEKEEVMQGPFSCNCAKVLICSQVVHKYIYGNFGECCESVP